MGPGIWLKGAQVSPPSELTDTAAGYSQDEPPFVYTFPVARSARSFSAPCMYRGASRTGRSRSRRRQSTWRAGGRGGGLGRLSAVVQVVEDLVYLKGKTCHSHLGSPGVHRNRARRRAAGSRQVTLLQVRPRSTACR